MEDNVMPNDGSSFQPLSEPEDQKIERQQEKGKFLEALPLVQDIIEHFTTEIDSLKSIEAIDEAERRDPTVFMNRVNANTMASSFLQGELEYLTGLQEEHLKNK